jgi:hypothetical protein
MAGAFVGIVMSKVVLGAIIYVYIIENRQKNREQNIVYLFYIINEVTVLLWLVIH